MLLSDSFGVRIRQMQFGLDEGFTILSFCLLLPRFLVGEVRVGRVSCDFLLSFNHSLTNFSIFLLLIISNLVIFSRHYKSYGVSLIKYAFGVWTNSKTIY